jgi:tetratricopeptide (TPR) repeat protein
METPFGFLKFVAKAALNAASFGIAGEFLVEVLPDIVRDVWSCWGQQRDEAERRAEVEAVAQAPSAVLAQQAEQIVLELASDRPPAERSGLAVYLTLIPNAIRQSLRRPEDPTGRTAPSALSLRKPEDLLPFLPTRVPRFKPGASPAGIGDWKLERLLGVGGFGEVWKARNPHLPDAPPVALKFCLDPTAAQVLRNEAAILARVMRQGRHPGIVSLLHTYLTADPPCLEYEYVSGGDLSATVYAALQKGKLTTEVASKVVYRLARIMTFAHRLTPPIVHRDLKPANVLVQRNPDGSSHFRIADFGIGGVAASQALEAGQKSSSGSSSSMLRGAHTPLYASPQQRWGASPDPRDDVHALGVIWYQLLIGDLTKGVPQGAGWIKRLGAQGVPPGLVELLADCIEEDPAGRPADAGVLAERLGVILKGPPPEPPVREPESPVEEEPPNPEPPSVKPEELFANARASQERGEHREALKLFKQALKAGYPVVDVSRCRAESHVARGDLDAALANLNIVVQREREVPAGYLTRGELYRLRGDLDRAITDFGSAARLDLRNIDAYLGRGRAYEDKGTYDLALADYNEALRLAPDRVDVLCTRARLHLLREDSDRALADCQQALQLQPDSAQAHFVRGQAMYRKGDLSAALAAFIEAIRLDPHNAQAYCGRGEVFAARGDDEQAISDFTQAVQIDRRMGQAYYQRGLAYLRLKKIGSAQWEFTYALKVEPKNVRFLLDRANCFLLRTNYPKAIADCTKVIRLDSANIEAYRLRGLCYAREGTYGRAIPDLTRVIDGGQADAEVLATRGESLAERKRLDEALADVVEALRREPNCAAALAVRGCVHARRDETEEALADLTEAIRLQPREGRFYRHRGKLYQTLGRHEEAVADLTKAIRYRPEDGALYERRARSYDKLGETDKAQADRERAGKQVPEPAKEEETPGAADPVS